jgi:redox-sensitive bicupin YhaK (pirin superfamily)
MEIITYVLEGELSHRDSMGNGSVIRPGNVQRMSAGSGVRHSEFNHSQEDAVHLLQIWIEPNVTGVDPSYEEKHFDAAQKRGSLRLIAGPDGESGAVTIHQDARVYAGLFDGDESASVPMQQGRRFYLHVARGEIVANGQALRAGDAMKLQAEPALELSQGRQAEVLLFELP